MPESIAAGNCGMLLFAAARAGRLVTTELGGVSDGSIAAYGLEAVDGALKVIVLNESLESDVTLAVDVPGATRASVMRLMAPRPDDTTDITFGGSVVGSDGAWMLAVTETLAAHHGLLILRMPKASGALVSLSA